MNLAIREFIEILSAHEITVDYKATTNGAYRLNRSTGRVCWLKNNSTGDSTYSVMRPAEGARFVRYVCQFVIIGTQFGWKITMYCLNDSYKVVSSREQFVAISKHEVSRMRLNYLQKITTQLTKA